MLAALTLLVAAPVLTPVVALTADGTAPDAERARVSGLVAQVLRGVDGLDVLAISDPAATLGEPAAAAIRACADDPCRVAALGAVARGAVVLATLDALGDRKVRLDLRVATATQGVTHRVSRDLAPPIEAGLVEAVGSLFPGRSVRPTARLTVLVDLDNVAIEVDDTLVGVSPLAPFDVHLGQRRVRALAPSGKVEETTVDVQLGGSSTVELSLRNPHGAVPFVLAGTAVALVAGGLVAGSIAASTASDWREACPAGERCAAGFTRVAYEADGNAIDTQRTVANGLFIAAGAAILGAVVVWFVEGGE